MSYKPVTIPTPSVGVEPASSYFSYKRVTQNPRELEAFLNWIEEKKINVYLEIGLYAGTTFKAVYDRLLKMWGGDTSKFLCFGIDLPQNPEAFKACNDLLETMPSVRVWWTSSTDKYTVEDVLRSIDLFTKEIAQGSLPRNKLGGEDEPHFEYLALIDGDHSYSQTKDDFLAYSHSFNYVAFNDVSQGTVKQNKKKHGGRDVATAFHFYDAVKIDNQWRSEIAFWDFPDEDGKYRGIGVLG